MCSRQEHCTALLADDRLLLATFPRIKLDCPTHICMDQSGLLFHLCAFHRKVKRF
jgi:hypothetical protein